MRTEEMTDHRVVHLQSTAHRHVRALCGRLPTWRKPLTTDVIDEVTCLNCLKRTQATADAKRAWARAVAVSIDGPHFPAADRLRRLKLPR